MSETRPWYEDDSFWETWGPFMFSEERIKNTGVETDKVIRLLRMAPGARVLDLCCGIGRHSLELARRGFRVTGVDRTVNYLKRAKNQADAEKLDIEFVHEDMRSFIRPETFDAVISLFTGFGYFEDIKDDKRVAANVYNSLKAGGRFIIDCHGKETLARVFQNRLWEEKDGAIHLQEQTISQNWSWMQSRWILIRGNERVEHTVSHRLYAATELAALLTECGFSRVDIYGDGDGSLYDHTARRLVAVGSKK